MTNRSFPFLGLVLLQDIVSKKQLAQETAIAYNKSIVYFLENELNEKFIALI